MSVRLRVTTLLDHLAIPHVVDGRVRDLPHEHPDYSLKYLARCIERKIRVDNVHCQRSEVQASLRSRGLALPAGVIDDVAAAETTDE
eukprot:4546959-Amphidinium_carterae.1